MNSALGSDTPDENDDINIDLSSGDGVYYSQLQQTRAPSSVSKGEIEEISSAIARMKNMALDISSEHDKQADDIDTLTESVTHANCRLKDNTKRMNKLL